MQYDIQERTFAFALQIIDLVDRLPATASGRVLGRQMLRSGTSIGANVEEAESAFSRNTFAYKMNVVLSEARETHYWLRLLTKSCQIRANDFRLLEEAEQLKKILGAIVSKCRGRSKR